MQSIQRTFWIALVLMALLWVAADPRFHLAAAVFEWRTPQRQYTGLMAMACMTLAVLLALRPKWPESWLGGLARMSRLHKRLGIAALAFAVLHWLWVNAPRWAVGWGWLKRPARGERTPIDNAVEAWFGARRGLAVMVVLLSAGTIAALGVLFRRVGARRKVPGTITAIRCFDGIDVPDWPGHKPGQFAFGPTDGREGAPAQLAADARSADIRLHVLISARDGRLTGERIRDQGPRWRGASLWFCGPAAFGAALRRDFAAHGLAVKQRFHQELFQLR